jgi:hypothetical protein
VAFSAPGDGLENSGGAAGAVLEAEMAFVPTKGGRPAIPGRRLPTALIRGHEINRVKGYETKRALIQLHVMEGKPLRECATLMGRNYRAIHAVWRAIVQETSPGGDGIAELRSTVRAYADKGLRALFERSMPLVEESAAHGALALKALEGLCRLHGVEAPDPGETTGVGSLAEIGAQVRAVSPLLADKLERVRALRIPAVTGDLPRAEKS